MQNYLSLLTVGLLWGSQFVFIEWSLGDFSAFNIALCRTIVGVLTLSLMITMLSKKGEPLSKKLAGSYFIIALFEATLPFYLIPYGQKNLDASLTAILLGMIPLYTIVISYFMYPQNRPGLNKWSGVVVGFAGLVSLFYPFDVVSFDTTSVLAVSAGGFCFALALNLIKKLPAADGLVSARNVLIASSLQLFTLGLYVDPVWNIRPHQLSLISVLYLGAVCTGLVYWLYFRLIDLKGPTFASFSNYLVPVTGVLLGVTTLGDDLSLKKLQALFIILAAVFISEINLAKSSSKS